MTKVELPEGESGMRRWLAGDSQIVNNRVTLIVETAEKPEDIISQGGKNRRSGRAARQKQSIQEYIILRRLAWPWKSSAAGHGHRWNL